MDSRGMDGWMNGGWRGGWKEGRREGGRADDGGICGQWMVDGWVVSGWMDGGVKARLCLSYVCSVFPEWTVIFVPPEPSTAAATE